MSKKNHFHTHTHSYIMICDINYKTISNVICIYILYTCTCNYMIGYIYIYICTYFFRKIAPNISHKMLRQERPHGRLLGWAGRVQRRQRRGREARLRHDRREWLRDAWAVFAEGLCGGHRDGIGWGWGVGLFFWNWCGFLRRFRGIEDEALMF